jgi:hypothetical protein
MSTFVVVLSTSISPPSSMSSPASFSLGSISCT